MTSVAEKVVWKAAMWVTTTVALWAVEKAVV